MGSRVRKSEAGKLADLEDHLFLLRDHLYRLNECPAHLKAMAAELRVLICLASGTEGLLWRLVDQYNVSDGVELCVAGNIDPEHPLARGINFRLVLIRRPDVAWEPQLPSHVYSFRKIVKHHEAVYSLGKGYTHERLIRAIAEQMGSAHEDDGVEPAVAEIQRLLIGGVKPYIKVLAIDAELTLEVGERVIAGAEESKGYKRLYRPNPVTVSLNLRLRELPLGRITIGTFRSYVAGVKVDVYLEPQSIIFAVSKYNNAVLEVVAPLPKTWRIDTDAAFSICYDSAANKIQAVSSGSLGQVIENCSLGFLDARDIPLMTFSRECQSYVQIKGFLTHSRLLTPHEVEQLPEYEETLRTEIS